MVAYGRRKENRLQIRWPFGSSELKGTTNYFRIFIKFISPESH